MMRAMGMMAGLLLGVAQAEPIRVWWDPYDEVANDVVGFNFYIGTQPGQYTQTIELRDGAAQEFVILGLDPGTYYCRMKALTSYGLESAFNVNEIQFTITTRTDPQPPAPVVNFQVTLEQSVDLRTWETLKSWTQSSGNQATFFRLRVSPPPPAP